MKISAWLVIDMLLSYLGIVLLCFSMVGAIIYLILSIIILIVAAVIYLKKFKGKISLIASGVFMFVGLLLVLDAILTYPGTFCPGNSFCLAGNVFEALIALPFLAVGSLIGIFVAKKDVITFLRICLIVLGLAAIYFGFYNESTLFAVFNCPANGCTPRPILPLIINGLIGTVPGVIIFVLGTLTYRKPK
jgi:hypothetical protein